MAAWLNLDGEFKRVDNDFGFSEEEESYEERTKKRATALTLCCVTGN